MSRGKGRASKKERKREGGKGGKVERERQRGKRKGKGRTGKQEATRRREKGGRKGGTERREEDERREAIRRNEPKGRRKYRVQYRKRRSKMRKESDEGAEDLNLFLFGHILFLKIVANKMCVPYKSEHHGKQGVLIFTCSYNNAC